MNTKQVLLSLATFLFLCSSCFKDSNFEFEVPETATIVTTSKREKGHFFIFFTEKGSAVSTEPSDDVDYIELRTEKAETCLIFNPEDPKRIYILNAPLILRTNGVKYTLRMAYDTHADTTFYRKEDKSIRSPYIAFDIDLMRYNIERSNDKKILKEGGLFGGW